MTPMTMRKKKAVLNRATSSQRPAVREPGMPEQEITGSFRLGKPLTVEVVGSPGTGNPTSVTLYYLGKDQEVSAIFPVPVGSGVGEVISEPDGGAKRVILEVDLPTGGSCMVKAHQGENNSFELPVELKGGTNSRRYVFDVVD